MSMTKSRKVLLVLIGIVVLVGVSWIIAANVVVKNGIKETSSSEQISQSVINALTVKTSDYNGALNSMGLVDFDVDALKGAPPRRWSDALALKIDSSDPAAMRDEIEEAIWRDPELGVTYAHFFANFKIGKINVGDLNPWLADYKADASLINDQAKGFVPLTDVTNPNDKQIEEAIKKNKEYQEFAGKVNTLINRFTREGVEDKRKSVLSYHLVGGGVMAGQFPEVEIDPEQEDKPALVFSIYVKAQANSCAKAQWGVNTGDKRPELFDVKCEGGTPGQPGTPNTTTPGTPGQPSGGGTPTQGTSTPPGTTTPGTTTPSTTTPTNPPLESKINTQIPGNGGRGDGGTGLYGNGQAPAVTGGPSGPAAGQPAPVWSAPAAPSVQVPQAPSVQPTTRPGPATTVAPSDQGTNNGSVGPGAAGCGNPDYC